MRGSIRRPRKFTVRQAFAAMLIAASVGASLSAQADEPAADGPRQLADVTLERSIAIGGHDIGLYSCRVRGFLWLDLYVSALYLPPEGLPAMGRADRAKAIRMTVLAGKILSNRMSDRYRDAMLPHVSETALNALDDRFATLDYGDTIWLVYSPKEGLSVQVNDLPLVHAPDHGAIDALLEAWGRGEPWAEKLERAVKDHRC